MDQNSKPISDQVVDGEEVLLTSGEVAAMFRVDPKTVSRWAQDGRIRTVRTPGGHRRYPRSAVHELMNGSLEERTRD